MSVLEYGHVEQVLRAAGLAMGPAAFHGALCGSLCAVPDGRAERVAAGMLASAEELAALPPGWLAATAEAVAEALGDGELGFVPLLPEDEAPLPARVRALAGWCDAFLGAYGVAAGAGCRRGSGARRDPGRSRGHRACRGARERGRGRAGGGRGRLRRAGRVRADCGALPARRSRLGHAEGKRA
ncbi:MAG: UPF0149 family protein [Xanthomonadales bacterium]|nr:UPF0149 family protein [Xanthomonadales bacterium]